MQVWQICVGSHSAHVTMHMWNNEPGVRLFFSAKELQGVDWKCRIRYDVRSQLIKAS